MMKNSIVRLAASATLAAGMASVVPAQAADLNDVFRVVDRINNQAQTSQGKIDALTEQTRTLFNEYKTVLKQIDGLKVYNAQLDRQVQSLSLIHI